MQTDSKNHETPTDANNVLCEVLPKTRKCDWCEKRKSVEQGYWLGKFESKKDWFICDKCNIEHGVV